MSVLLVERFSPYGLSHWVVLVLFAVGAVVLITGGNRYRDTAVADWISKGLAAAILAVQVPHTIYTLLPGQFDINTSLPMQLSDLAWMAAAVALWTHRQWAFALTYYWGLTLEPQALLTPEVDGFDFPHLDFLVFFSYHLLVVWGALYLTFGLSMRPRWRDYGIAVGATLCWGLVTLTFNSVAGSNYGFLNEKPAVGSLLNLLGDWPWYLLSELALGLAVWALITWPWVRTSPRRAGTRPGPASTP
ncbi:MAG: TIGR02206 family membrane protein [Pseudonocardiaceae bacterium]|nr:TIGR02206 family membrane protein [Pseudonocardiaceae bacterium]